MDNTQTPEAAEDGPAPQVNLELPLHSYVSQSLDIDFRETSFFSNKDVKLPSPLEVYARQGQYPGQRIAIFKELNLVIKLGSPQDGRLEEALTMQALRKIFPGGEVPVPEIFGCRTYKGTHFIYMSLVPGVSLSKGWDELNADDKVSICDQLGRIQSYLLSLGQGASGGFVGRCLSPIIPEYNRTQTHARMASRTNCLPYQRNRVYYQRLTT